MADTVHLSGGYQSILGKGLDADKPTAFPGDFNIAFYYATDTQTLYVAEWQAAGTDAVWNAVAGGSTSPLQLPVMTVSGGTNNLPAAAAANKGQVAWVTDLNSLTVGSTAAHGSAGQGIVGSDGTNWIVGALGT